MKPSEELRNAVQRLRDDANVAREQEKYLISEMERTNNQIIAARDTAYTKDVAAQLLEDILDARLPHPD